MYSREPTQVPAKNKLKKFCNFLIKKTYDNKKAMDLTKITQELVEQHNADTITILKENHVTSHTHLINLGHGVYMTPDKMEVFFLEGCSYGEEELEFVDDAIDLTTEYEGSTSLYVVSYRFSISSFQKVIDKFNNIINK